MIARVTAGVALTTAVVVVALIILGNGPAYTLRANFQDAGGLVAGDDVLIGPARVGSVKSIDLTPDGKAQVVMGLQGSASPMHDGTVARIYENSLSGIANKYVVLQPGPTNSPSLPENSLISEDHTHSFVGLDQLFDTFDPLTRAGLRDFIQGEAASIAGRPHEANATLRYFAPALASTSDVTAELARDEPTFDGLVVQGAQAMQALASRSQQLTELIANTNATTAAIANQSVALERALSLFPSTLTRSTATFKGLNTTLDALDPLVAESKPAVRRLAPFSGALRAVVSVAIPTVAQLDGLIHNPAGTGDLTTLALQTPALARVAAAAFPRLIRQMNDSQSQLDYLREYTPDLVAALTNLGQVGAYYDADGHYARTSPVFFAYALGPGNVLTPKPAFARYQNVQVVHGRCPGSAAQPAPDASAPWAVPGCSPSSTPPGP